jgi:ketosteroid isomerase-like protein
VRRRLLTFCACMLLLAMLAAAQAPIDKEEQTLQTLIPKIVNAWGSMDMTKVDPYYAKDADFTYFDIAPMKYENWQAYREGAAKLLFDPNQSLTLTVNNDLRIHRKGSLAWATFTFGVDIVNKQNAKSHLDGRWTMVLEKRPQGWMVVHEHVSAPLPGS